MRLSVGVAQALATSAGGQGGITEKQYLLSCAGCLGVGGD